VAAERDGWDDEAEVLAEQLAYRDADWYPALGDDGVVEHLAFMVADADHGLRLPATGGAERGPRIPDLMDMIVTWLRRALPPGRG
jgi:hypothetical protein